jgi:putative transposase
MCEVLGVARGGFYARKRRAIASSRTRGCWRRSGRSTLPRRRPMAPGASPRRAAARGWHSGRTQAGRGADGRSRSLGSLCGRGRAPGCAWRGCGPGCAWRGCGSRRTSSSATSAPKRQTGAECGHQRDPDVGGQAVPRSLQDLFSRRIVGWAMAAPPHKELVIDARQMAIEERRPAKGSCIIPITDRSSVHSGAVHTAMRAGRGRGLDRIDRDCYDNAVCESFHASRKKELIHRRPWPTRAEARTKVVECQGRLRFDLVAPVEI